MMMGREIVALGQQVYLCVQTNGQQNMYVKVMYSKWLSP